MRRLFVGMVVAAATAIAPVWAMAGNQEVAEQIAASLRKSGQLRGYKIGVKYRDGTAWLAGRVSSREQLDAAIKLAAETPGVRHVVNHLTVAAAAKATGTLRQSAGALGPEQLMHPIFTDLAAWSATSRVTAASPLPAQRLSQVAPRPVWASVAPRPGGATISQRLSQVAQQRLAPPTGSRAEPVPTSFAQTPAARAMATAVSAPQPPTNPPARVQSPQTPRAQPRPYGMTKQGRARARGLRSSEGVTSQVVAPVPATAQFVAVPIASITAAQLQRPMPVAAQPIPQYITPVGGGVAPARYDQPHMPNYAWPSYAAYPNYAALTYPKQYSPTAWPYIGPFYPYPQVPLGWRKVVLEWHDGWWQLDFDDGGSRDGPISGLFRPFRKR